MEAKEDMKAKYPYLFIPSTVNVEDDALIYHSRLHFYSCVKCLNFVLFLCLVCFSKLGHHSKMNDVKEEILQHLPALLLES